MDTQYHPTLHCTCAYLSILRLKLIRISKVGSWCLSSSNVFQNLSVWFYMVNSLCCITLNIIEKDQAAKDFTPMVRYNQKWYKHIGRKFKSKIEYMSVYCISCIYTLGTHVLSVEYLHTSVSIWYHILYASVSFFKARFAKWICMIKCVLHFKMCFNSLRPSDAYMRR